MAKRPLPDQALLLKLLRYEPETGKLFWRPRPLSLFELATRSEQSWKTWNSRYAGKEAFTAHRGGYRCGAVFGACFQAHRIIWRMVTGVDVEGEIDHINGKRNDNRWSNLKAGTTQDNRRNSAIGRHNSSGVCGVGWHNGTGRWRATITVNHRQIHLGRFDTFEEAVFVRKAAERRYGFHPNHGRSRSC